MSSMSSSEANSSSDTSGRPPSWPTSWRLPSSWRLPYVVPAVGGGGRAGGVVLAAGTGGEVFLGMKQCCLGGTNGAPVIATKSNVRY